VKIISEPAMRFDDGEGYERYMGKWSQLVGHEFLQWLAPKPGLRWLDVGCGNGAFTAMIIERCAPAAVKGVDPAEGQIAFARSRPDSRLAQFGIGDAMALPFPDDSFDAAVMPLVLFFVPNPPQGVAEMARVVCPGGIVTAYSWDMIGGGFPYQSLQAQMREMNAIVKVAPNPDASRMKVLRELWLGAGLEAVETQEITVQRTYENFEDYWTTILRGPSVRPGLTAMSPENLAKLQYQMRVRLPPDAQGRITISARANAIRGRVVPTTPAAR
jgi:ubiquinone/menaquinone biosynthesis C-methylase UbiE